MSRDIRNIIRGKCESCSSCSSFISVSGRVRCDYCGCPPAQNQHLEEDQQQQQQEQQQDRSVVRRSVSSNGGSADRLPSSSMTDDFRSCISDGEAGSDCSVVRVVGFRSDSDLLNHASERVKG